jgi:hypothetical protein
MTGRSSTMPITPDARSRLARLMDERRRALRLRWQDVAEAGRISLKTLHSVRTGSAGIAPLTERAVETGLQWTMGSVAETLAGGVPTPLEGVQPQAPRRTGVFDLPVGEGELEPHLAAVEAEVRRAEALAYPGRPAGRDIFDKDYAILAWDHADLGREQAIMLIAQMRVLEARAERERGRRTG